MTRAVARRSLPLEAWPETERLGWLGAVEADNGLFSKRPRPKWRPITVKGIQGSYGRWLAWLKDEHPSLFILGPAERLTRETVALYIEELRHRMADTSIGTALIHVQVVVRGLFPDVVMKWLRPIVSRLRRTGASRRRKAERVVPSGKLLGFGLELMRFGRASTPADSHAALLCYRDGLIIALLAIRPLRLGNFLSVRIGVHLRERHGELWLCFAGGETKNGFDLELPFPPGLRSHLAIYLEIVRLRLIAIAERNGRGKTDCLWLSQNGSPLARQTLYAMLKRRTVARFGKALGPHLFRDCLATTLATSGRDISWTIPYMLGHETSASSERSYTHTGGAPEHLLFQRHLEELRGKRSTLGARRTRLPVAAK